jgi:zinc transporter
MESCEGEVFSAGGPPSGVWLHFDLVDSRARAWIEQHSGIPEAARELLLDAHPRSRLQVVSGGLTVVLDDAHHDFRDDPDAFDMLRLYLDSHRLISGRMRPLKTTDAIRRELVGGAVTVGSGAELFALFVERLAGTFREIITGLADFVDEAEDEVLAGKTRERAARIGHVRRMLARLRRHLNSNRAALRAIPYEALGLWATPERTDLKQSLEQWDDLSQEAELVQERARLVQEEITSRLNEATNRNLYFISIATALMLPTTLITGMWGMNVGGLPFAEHAHGFFIVVVLMFSAVGLALFLLRASRLL